MKIKLKHLLLLTTVVFSNYGYAQTSYEMLESNDVVIKLMGTSTLHDWEMEAHHATGEAQFMFESATKKELRSLKSLWFVLHVKELKSDNKELDKNAYKALKSEEFKNIHYVLTSSTLVIENGGYLIKSEGKLTIAGVTRKINLNVHAAINSDGTLTCKGSYKLNMTDYNVVPPTFMWGAMKTGDAITLGFELIYKNSKGV